MNIFQFKPKKKQEDIKAQVESEPSYRVYARAIDRFAESRNKIKTMSKDDFKKLLYLQVKYVEAVNKEKSLRNDIDFYKKSPMERFKLLDAIVQEIGVLTPTELLQMFPVDKYYKGHKIQFKDYFYTMNEINKLDLDKSIGAKIFELLWDYQNWTLTFFMLEVMSTMNLVGMYQGKPDMVDMLEVFSHEGEEVNKNPDYLKVVKWKELI